MYDKVDWYEILRISPQATDDEIKKAWRHRVKEAHPDTNGGADAEDRTKLINIAKDILLDKYKRLAFDLRRAKWKKQEEEEKRREENRKERQTIGEKTLEQQLEIERRRRKDAEERLRGMGWYDLREELRRERELREQAERNLRFEEEFNSAYRSMYDERKSRSEQAEERARWEQRRAEQAEQRVEMLENLLEDFEREFDICVYEKGPYGRPYERYKTPQYGRKTESWARS